MRIYFFSCGSLTSKKNVFYDDAPDEDFEVPVPFYLIIHNDNYILFDTGNHKNDIEGHYPPLVTGSSKPHFTKDEWAPNAMQSIGVEPEKINYIITSHLHHDHCGALTEFPNAQIIVQKKEYEFAHAPTDNMKRAYYECEFPADLDWKFIDGENEPVFDLFNDGRLLIYFTPGHTPGQQSLLVKSDNNGSLMFTSDACYLQDSIKKDVMPGLIYNKDAYIKNIALFKQLSKNGVKIIVGHDPQAWAAYKHAPLYYE